MRRIKKYQNEDDEFLHPFWLGLLMLFTVTCVIGILCFLRKKCGSHIRHLFNCLCCKNQLNNEHHSKTNIYLSTTGPYNWAPLYVPPPSLSPKFYKLVRNVQMSSLDKDSFTQRTESNNNSIDNDVFSISNESDHIKAPVSQLDKNRNSETARKLYASMRQISLSQNSSSLESENNETTANRFTKSNRNKKLNLFHTQRFFQSIANTND